MIAGLAPEVKFDRVRLCVIDPKGGMELGAGAPMFSEFCVDDGGATVQMLRRLVALMQDRAARLRGHTRLHTPTADEPQSALKRGYPVGTQCEKCGSVVRSTPSR